MPAIKTRTNIDRFSYHTLVEFGAYGTTVDATTEWSETTQQQRTGTYLPNYRQLVKAHVNATTTFSGSKEVYSCGASTLMRSCERPDYVPYGKYLQRTHGPIRRLAKPVGSRLSVSQTDAVTKAIEVFVANATRKRQAMMAGVTAGELMKTIKTILNPARAIQRGLNDYLRDVKKHRGKVKQRNKKRFLQDKWLEYRFGWRPLCGEIDGAMRVLGEDHSLRPDYAYVTGEGRSVASEPYYPVITQGSGVSVYQNTNWTEMWEARYYGEVRVAPHRKGFGNYKALLGVDGGDWLPTIWELLPFSFVVDYFSNIGNVLSALALGINGGITWVSSSVRNTILHETADTYGITVAPFNDSTDFKQEWEAAPGAEKWEITTVNRAPHYGPLIPSLRMEVPGFGSAKWFDLAALATVSSSMRPY